ncbi:MAG TPA: amino acid adenylation domain-containing protein, partial [Ktedonobacteraceae bacterium]|nr:amino acid adenylation domain-containing protein [Ktedonobacteraceae bacterium]
MQTTELRGVSLSLQQNRLWPFLQDNLVYRVQGAVWLEGDLDEDTFQRALSTLVEQHEILQTVFHTLAGMDVPVQVIGRRPLLHCPAVNLERFTPSVQQMLLDASYDMLQTQPFDMTHGPIFRSMLFRISVSKHLLLVSLPALCADAATLPLFIAELVQQYERASGSSPLHCGSCPDSDEPLQYSDVTAWQDELLELESANLPRDFWNKIDLAQARPPRLPFASTECTADNSLAGVQQGGFEPRSLAIAVDERQIVRLCRMADTYTVTMTDLLLSCWQVALWRLMDEAPFVMGVACDGRDQEDLASVLGPYIRFVPVGLAFGEHWTFAQVMTTVSQSLQAAKKWQSYFTWNDQGSHDGPKSFESVPRSNAADALAGQGQARPLQNAESKYFSLAFEHQSWPATISGGPLVASLHRTANCNEPFIIKLRVLQVGKQFQLELHYDPRLFSDEHAGRLSSVFRALLQGALEQPQAPIRDLPLLGPVEQEQLIKLFQAPKQAFPASGFHQLFEEQARKTPCQLALVSADEQVTYQALNSRANRLARVLQRRGAGPRVPVGLCLPRSGQMIVVMLAIFKAGAAYVPLDPESPPTRLAYQLQDVQPPLLITEQDLSSRLPQFDGQVVTMQMLWSEAVQEDTSNLPVSYGAENPAYIIYTSGSTGVPKGVVVRQGSVVNYTSALCALLKPEPGWHFATVSTLAADLGNTAIFCALAAGGCLQVPDYAIVTSAEAFACWGAQRPIDVLKIVPSHLSALLIGDHARDALPRKALLLGGEALPTALLERIRAQKASCVVYNHYGPTETTIGVLVNEISTLNHSEEVRRSLNVPLGRPIANTDVYVLSPSLQVVPVGVTGELYIGGAGLAEGYLHQPEQTAERFVPNPFVGTPTMNRGGTSASEPGGRLYRTGDLVRSTEQGLIEFLGRRDGQVKLRGYRIELGEIEAVLRQHNNVWDCAVMLREDGGGGPQLVGYIVARKQPAPTHAELHAFLRTHVPEYMIPSLFMTLKVLPLTANGKVNRRQLPKPEVSLNQTKTALTLPQGPIEEMLLDIWKDLLALPEIDVHGNFFHLGGHSLLATQVISRVRATLQVELPIQSLFEHPTIAELARQVERLMRGAGAKQVPPLLPADRTAALPLSFAQQRLWFLDQLEPGGTTYLIPRTRRIYGALDVAVLERSLAEVIRRHEDLRTTFQEQAGRPVQVIHPAEAFCLPVIDLRGLVSAEREDEARRLARQEAQRPCSLAEGPLLRTVLLALDAQDHVLCLTMHHIISDGWSNDVFERELTALYRAFTAGKPSPLPPLPIQYADFAVWQRQCLQGEMLETQLAYWRNQLANVLPLALPTDRPRPAKQTFRGASSAVSLPATLHEKLLALSQQEGVTLFMLLLAAFQVLLMRYTGQDDICVGTPVANRTRAEVEGLIGFFVNTLVLRTKLSGNPSFTEALQRVRQMALEAYLHQDVPFEYLVDALQPERDLSRSPLFQVMFSMQHLTESVMEAAQGQPEQLSFGDLDSQHTTSKFDLTFSIMSSGQELHCGVEYNTDLFESATIQRLLEHWQILLEHIVTAPQTALSDLRLLSERERHLLLAEWNSPPRQEARAQCLHTLFEQQVVRRPEAVAVVCGEESLTYEQLNLRANQLAHALRRAGVGPGKMVGLVLERSPLLIVGVLGTLKAGGAYIPLDPSYPAERLEFMLADSQVSVLLTQQSLREHMSVQEIPVLSLDIDWSGIAENPTHNLLDTAEAQQLAYVIYTSGSTGRPKGVMVNHANVFQLFAATQSWYHCSEDDVWTLFHSYAFDFSVWEIWGALLHGGQLVVVPYEVSRTPEIFYTLLATHGVTVLNQTPSAFRQLMQVEAVAEQRQPLALRLIIFGGEALDLPSLQPWFNRHGEHMPRLVNMYGITETTVHVTYRPLSRQDVFNAAGSVIGVPIPSLQVYVLDEYLQPVPIGVPGQMYVGGSGVSRGYLNHP